SSDSTRASRFSRCCTTGWVTRSIVHVRYSRSTSPPDGWDGNRNEDFITTSRSIAGVGSCGALWQYCHSVERADGPEWQWQYCYNAPVDPTPAIKTSDHRSNGLGINPTH